MNKPNLKQILSDMEEGKIVSKAFVKEALEYAVELEDSTAMNAMPTAEYKHFGYFFVENGTVPMAGSGFATKLPLSHEHYSKVTELFSRVTP